MPYQLNWQFVVMKSEGLVHEAGVFAEATGGIDRHGHVSASRIRRVHGTNHSNDRCKTTEPQASLPLPRLICMHLFEFALFSWAEWLGDSLITSGEWCRMTKVRASCAYATVTPAPISRFSPSVETKS
jgi:hypothetical protein